MVKRLLSLPPFINSAAKELILPDDNQSKIITESGELTLVIFSTCARKASVRNLAGAPIYPVPHQDPRISREMRE